MNITLPPRSTLSDSQPPWADRLSEPAWHEMSDWERQEIWFAWRECETYLIRLAERAADALYQLHAAPAKWDFDTVTDPAIRSQASRNRLVALLEGAKHRYFTQAREES